MEPGKGLTMAETQAKQDEAGLIFFQIWLSVLITILTFAFSD